MNQKGFSPILILLLVLIVLGSVGGAYFLGTQKSSSPQSESVSPPTPAAKSLEGFTKRQFKPGTVFFNSYGYPKEVENIPEENLISMKCTPQPLFCHSPYEVCPAETMDKKDLTILTAEDKKLLALMKGANKTIDKVEFPGLGLLEVWEASSCETADGRQILRYATTGGGGGAGSKDYIGLVKTDGTVDRLASMSEDMAYFGCRQPLQLTKENILYYQCNWGDVAGGASIYAIDLKNKTSGPVYACSSLADDLNSPETTFTTSCK